MQQKSYRALARLATLYLCTSALTVPAVAASFSVGGGTITTSQADASVDNTGTSGGFELQANTTGNNDTIAVSNVTINGGGRSLDIGGALPSAGSYSVIMHGSSLTGGGAWLQSVGGLISLDTTGVAANTMSGSIGLTVTNGTGNGAVALNLGADTITGAEAVQTIGQGTGTISIDMAGTTVTSSGTYGVVAQNGLGNITIGGLNGGISANITANSGYGIYSTSNGTISVTIAAGGGVTALNGIYLLGGAEIVNNFGTISAANNAIDASFANSLTVTLQSGSVTSGILLGSSGSDTFTIFNGANIGGATFNGNGGTDTLILTGSGNGTFSLASATNISSFQMLGSGTWTLTGSGAGGWSIASGTLQIGNGGTTGSVGGNIANNSALVFNRSDAVTYSGSIGGTGSVSQAGTGTLILTGTNTYAGVTTLASGSSLQIGNGGTSGTLGSGTVTGAGTLIFNRSDTITVANTIQSIFNNAVRQAGGGTTILTGANTYNGGTTITAGTLQVGNGGTSGSLGSGGVVDNSALVFNRSDNFTVISAISGSGSLTQAGTGTLVLNSSNTYSGTTSINGGGTLQVGPGGTNGTLGSGNVIDNGTLAIDHTDNVNLGNAISGSGGLTQMGSGILTLSGAANSYSGGTVVHSGTLQISGSGTLGSNSGSLSIVTTGGTPAMVDLGGTTQIQNGGATISATIQNGTLSSSGTFTLNGANVLASLAGTGGVVVTGGNGSSVYGVNTYMGPTLIQGANSTLGLQGTASIANSSGVNVAQAQAIFSIAQVSGGGSSITSLSGNGVVNLGSNTLTLTNASGTFSGLMQGAGQIVGQPGAGGLTLIGGTETFATGAQLAFGTLTINGGTLQLATGASFIEDHVTLNVQGGTFDLGGTAETGIGNVTLTGGTIQNGTLSSSGTFALQSGTVSAVLAGSAAASKTTSGTVTLSATNTYSSPTTVSAGTLNITGSIASSAVTVQSGATLTGTGKVGTTTIASGGTLTPGSSITPGTLSVTGNLTLASGANYADAVTSTAAGLTNVSGTASINSNAIVSFASGTYTLGQRYTLLAATGNVSGTFSSLNTLGLPTNLRGRLSYDTNNVYLNLDPNVLAPSLSGATANQYNVVTAIDAAVTAGAAPSGGFLALYGLSGAALNNAIDQISGQIGPNVTNSVGQGFLSFLSMTGQGGSSDSGSFAPGSAYGAADAPHRAQLGAGETRVWGAAYGGHVGLSADAAGGARLSSSNVGMIGGADMAVDDGLLAGVTLGIGRQNFHSGNGTGSSDDFMIGAYARKDVGPLYVTAAFGYGWHQIKTLRLVTVSGTDMLQGKENADDFGGRIEAGWRMALDAQYALSPYIAVAAGSFQSPAYAETALSGASTFALSVAAHDTTLGRSELGARLARNYETDNGTLAAELHAAWAHELDDQPFTQASFQGLPGVSFTVTGVRPAGDSALLGADLHIQNRSGLFFGVKAETQLGTGTTILEGMGDLGWRW